jgi:hypothetical protein
LLPTEAAEETHSLREANGSFRLVKTALGALMNVAMDQGALRFEPLSWPVADGRFF